MERYRPQRGLTLRPRLRRPRVISTPIGGLLGFEQTLLFGIVRVKFVEREPDVAQDDCQLIVGFVRYEAGECAQHFQTLLLAESGFELRCPRDHYLVGSCSMAPSCTRRCPASSTQLHGFLMWKEIMCERCDREPGRRAHEGERPRRSRVDNGRTPDLVS